MSVHCRQVAEGEPDQTYIIAPHFDGQTDAELLAAKAKGAEDKGWTVKRGDSSFTATKVRWADVECVRTFWIE